MHLLIWFVYVDMCSPHPALHNIYFIRLWHDIAYIKSSAKGISRTGTICQEPCLLVKAVSSHHGFASPYSSFICDECCVGSGVVRIHPFRFLAGCRKRQLKQALSVLSLSLGFF